MFKKLFVLSFALLLLCGCADNKTVTPVLDNISFTAQIDYGDSEFVGNATLSNDTLNLTITEPQEIKDLILKLDKNGVAAEFKGVTYTPDINSLPQGAIAQVLYNILNDIAASQDTAICGEENCVIENKINGYDYEFTFSPSGLPISLEIDDLDLEIKFKNVTVN
ncbi:MAG: hypothetical protein IJZ21_06655 [Clostridia bacterium]|nr:hypothetical protein [Clostridia bacterium]